MKFDVIKCVPRKMYMHIPFEDPKYDVTALDKAVIWLSPDNNHLLGQRWHFVGSFVGPTSTNDVSTMSFCSSGQRNIAKRWFDVGPTPVAQQALHMPT